VGSVLEQKNKDEVVAIALEIKNYLKAHPNAVDSLEGITKWWLTRQRYEEAESLVQKALNILLTENSISKQQVVDGRVVYGNTEKEFKEKSNSI